jgi:HEAT repeat protein
MEHRRQARQTERRLAVLLAVGVLLALIVVELGRGLLAMHELEQFVSTIEQTPAAEVKREVARWAQRLNDMDPLVRNAAISAMKVATGKNLAPMSGAWMAWWRENEATWQYQPPRSHAAPPPTQQPAQP